MPLEVLFDDNHCLVVNKPARLLTMGDETGDETLLDQAKSYIAQKYFKPGAVYLGVVHRLDRPVSGVVLFARTSKSAARLSEQFRLGHIQKTYWAVVTGPCVPPEGRLTDWLVKDRASNVVRVAPTPNSATPKSRSEGGPQECVLDYSELNASGAQTLLEIRPQTGRSHQIRVQLANAGWPIVGDGKYGSAKSTPAILLHARRLVFEHPVTKALIDVVAAVPRGWPILPL